MPMTSSNHTLPSRVGFLCAALAATAMSFCSLEAMKQQHDDALACLPLEKELVPEVTSNILSLSLACDNATNLVCSINKLRRSCIADLPTFAQALKTIFHNNDTFKLDSL